MLQSDKACAPLLSASSGAHELQQLSPSTATTEACTPTACVPQEKNHRDEKPVNRNEEQPPVTATRESPSAATKSHATTAKI